MELLVALRGLLRNKCPAYIVDHAPLAGSLPEVLAAFRK